MKYKPLIIIEIFGVNKEKIFDLMENQYGYKLEMIEEENYICTPQNINVFV
jgi:hypothetical protein